MVWLAIGVAIICVLLILYYLYYMYYLNIRLSWHFLTKLGTKVFSFLKSHMPRATTKTLLVTILVLVIAGTSSAIILAVTRDGNHESPPPPTLSLDEARSLAADYIYSQFDDVPCAGGKRLVNFMVGEFVEGVIYASPTSWNDAGYWMLNAGNPVQFTVYGDSYVVAPNGEARDILNFFKDKCYEVCR